MEVISRLSSSDSAISNQHPHSPIDPGQAAIRGPHSAVANPKRVPF